MNKNIDICGLQKKNVYIYAHITEYEIKISKISTENVYCKDLLHEFANRGLVFLTIALAE